MDYEKHFRAALDQIRSEGRYRVFADVLRRRGAYPNAERVAGSEVPSRSSSGARTTISAWASIPL